MQRPFWNRRGFVVGGQSGRVLGGFGGIGYAGHVTTLHEDDAVI